MPVQERRHACLMPTPHSSCPSTINRVGLHHQSLSTELALLRLAGLANALVLRPVLRLALLAAIPDLPAAPALALERIIRLADLAAAPAPLRSSYDRRDDPDGKTLVLLHNNSVNALPIDQILELRLPVTDGGLDQCTWGKVSYADRKIAALAHRSWSCG